MRRSTLLTLVMLAVLSFAAYWKRDFIVEQYGELKARFFGSDDTAPAPATSPAVDTARGETARATPATRTPPRPRSTAPQYPTASRPLRDEPYVSDDTGTIDPGMSEREVYALWGAPVGLRRAGEWTYLYFRNGCEYSCGTYDVVFLQNGMVVDAVLRWPGHGYSGQSSSPPGTVPLPTRGGDTLVVPPPPPSPRPTPDT